MEVSQNSVSKRYNCSKCGFETDYIVHLKSHLCSPKKCEKGSVESYSKGCHQNTSPVDSSYQRLKKICKFSCSDCGYSCKSFGLLKLHKNIHYMGLYKCSLCSFITNFENLYRMHKDKHTDIQYGSQEVNNKSFYSEPDNKVTVDTSNDLECNKITVDTSNDLECKMTVEDENNSPVKLNDGVKTEMTTDRNACDCCSLCPFRTIRVKTLGKHLIRFHGKELSVNIAKFLGKSYVKPTIRNVVSPEEMVSLTTAMKVSDGIVGKSSNIYAQIDAAEIPLVKSAINKIKNYLDSPKSKKLKSWSKEEKLEIYWCDVFARNAIFPKLEISKRRRKALMKRGVLSPQKLKDTPNTLLHSITANIKIGKSSVTRGEALAVIKEVEDYVKSKVNSADNNMRESGDFEYLFNFASVSQNKRVIRKLGKGI